MSSRPEDNSRTQKTQPRGKDKETGETYPPIDIPVPKRVDVDDVLRKAARPSGARRPSE